MTAFTPENCCSTIRPTPACTAVPTTSHHEILTNKASENNPGARHAQHEQSRQSSQDMLPEPNCWREWGPYNEGPREVLLEQVPQRGSRLGRRLAGRLLQQAGKCQGGILQFRHTGNTYQGKDIADVAATMVQRSFLFRLLCPGRHASRIHPSRQVENASTSLGLCVQSPRHQFPRSHKGWAIPLSKRFEQSQRRGAAASSSLHKAS